MTGNTYDIANSLFKSGSLKNVSIGELKEVSSQYPFFGAGHYLLSQKLFAEKSEDFLTETKKTALYFNNPFWLKWLLENAPDERDIETKALPNEELKEVSPAATLVEELEMPAIIEPTVKKQDFSGDELLFQPYHTVDYFASQGIRFIEEENPGDKFGKQLKSFTEWLKILKKMPQHPAENNVGITEQAAIAGIAEHSVEQKEIITEAMADVLAKQGMHEEAVRLYRKLSLLYPSKSTYFAAKIEQLNSH
ncbi:MAG TPA: hypothetical protein VMT76_02400 [Puia sp.]|nr:hypothetical protein [Puia sp.]